MLSSISFRCRPAGRVGQVKLKKADIGDCTGEVRPPQMAFVGGGAKMRQAAGNSGGLYGRTSVGGFQAGASDDSWDL